MNTCSHCQTNNESEAHYCNHCGQLIGGSITIQQENDFYLKTEDIYTTEPTVPAVDLFVGRKADYYNRKWEKAAQKNGLSFNIAAFLLSFLWLGYRKVYKPIFLFAALFLSIDIILYIVKFEYALSSFSNPIDRAVGSAVTFILAFYGNAIYKRHVDKKIQTINETVGNASEQEDLYKKKGGTSWLGVLWAILILSFVYLIPTAFIPMYVNPIDNVQKSTIEYTQDNEDFTIRMEVLLQKIFTDGKWDYADQSASKEHVIFTGEYHENGEKYDFIISFFAKDYSEDILVTNITVDGEDLYFDEDFSELDFLLNLTE